MHPHHCMYVRHKTFEVLLVIHTNRLKLKPFNILGPSNVAVSVKRLLTKMTTTLATRTPNGFNLEVKSLFLKKIFSQSESESKRFAKA